MIRYRIPIEKHRIPIEEVRLKNFKAIRDSEPLRLDALTVFIGNNGSGKSSVIEALEMVKRLASSDLDSALGAFRGFEHVRYKGVKKGPRAAPGVTQLEYGPISLSLRGHHKNKRFIATTEIGLRENNDVFFRKEKVTRAGFVAERRDDQVTTVVRDQDPKVETIERDVSILRERLSDVLEEWQFVRLNPEAMGAPRAIKRSGARVRLSPDGANVAEYLLEMAAKTPDDFHALFEALNFVLPYAKNFKVELLSELERQAYLQIAEGEFNVPGWMLSTGTLRIAALLALFRHPAAPEVLFIEELENGLDPRTIGLIVEEIRSAVLSGRQQVILTTHSPYLLDLFPLESIVMVEREEGAPTFWRPNDVADIQKWKDKFAPGRMYMTGTFSRGSGA